MEDRVIQFRVGVLVVATAIITLILIVLFGELPYVLQDTKTVYIRYRHAPGVTVNTPVRKSGILVGRVTHVKLEPDGSVLVTARLDGDWPIREDETCRISTNFLGDAVLEFVTPAPAEATSAEPLADGAYLNGSVSRDAIAAMGDAMTVFTELASDIQVTLKSIDAAGSEIGHVARNLNVLVVNNQDQFNRLLGKTERAMGQFDTAMASVNQLVEDDQIVQKLNMTLDAVPKFLEDADKLIVNLSRVASEAERNLHNLTGLTEPLGQQGREIVMTIDQAVGRLDSVLQDLQQFTSALKNGEGSLAQFINNPDLYQRLNAAAANVEELTFRMRPVVENARVVSDKLARDPARLLRGAIGPQRSGLK